MRCLTQHYYFSHFVRYVRNFQNDAATTRRHQDEFRRKGEIEY